MNKSEVSELVPTLGVVLILVFLITNNPGRIFGVHARGWRRGARLGES